jgi:hypothetical protein
MTAERRLVRITAANLKHSHLYVTGLRDFFPPEAFGGAKRKNGDGEIRFCLTNTLGILIDCLGIMLLSSEPRHDVSGDDPSSQRPI